MAPPPPVRASMSGGFPIAIGAIGGAAVGFLVGQPTACFFVGVALGVAVAVVIWLIDRRR